MAEESGDISSAMVLGIGVALFLIIVGIWYVFIK